MANIDIQEKYWDMCFVFKDDPKKKVKYFDRALPHYFKVLSDRVERNLKEGKHKFIVGNSLTIADFDNLAMYTSIIVNPENFYTKESEEIALKYPHVKMYINNLKKEFKDYLKTRPKRPC
jgi:glutathionyl-hydroquinone reductase